MVSAQNIKNKLKGITNSIKKRSHEVSFNPFNMYKVNGNAGDNNPTAPMPDVNTSMNKTNNNNNPVTIPNIPRVNNVKTNINKMSFANKLKMWKKKNTGFAPSFTMKLSRSRKNRRNGNKTRKQ
jgi:hypothetical protein